MTAHRTPTRRGFTMIELIVVLLIISILASAIAPRFAGQADRKAEATAGEVKELLSTVGTRAMTTPQATAVTYDAQRKQLFVEVQVAEGDPADFTKMPVWASDPFSPQVALGDVELRAAWVSGAYVQPKGLRIELPVGVPKPSISLLLTQPRSEIAWRVDLEARSGRAQLVRTGPNDPGPLGDAGVVDLDAMGLSETSW